MKVITCFLFVMIVIGRADCQVYEKQSFNISIQFTAPMQPLKAYLLYQTEGRKIYDSCSLLNGHIEFNGTIRGLVPATIVVDREKTGLGELLKKGPKGIDYLKIYLYPETAVGFTDSLIERAHFSKGAINQDFAVLGAAGKAVLDEWGQVGLRLREEKNADTVKVLRAKHDSLTYARIPILEQFILTHPNSIMSLVAWEEWKALLLRKHPDNINQVRTVFESLSSEVRSSDEAATARLFFVNNMRLKVGGNAPDFAQQDIQGKTIRLSDFRGKYVLVDFWASWCGPCRANHPALVELYNEFKSGNFTILGVSLDDVEGKQKWKDAIKKDGLKWQQVSDLKHWENAAAKEYSVSAIPFSVLVAPDGKIVKMGGSVPEIRKLLNDSGLN